MTFDNVYLCNNYAGIAKSNLTVKDGGELRVSTAFTPVRAGVTVTGIGGSGCVLTVENGGKLTFPVNGDPIQYTISANVNYDPKLVVKFNKGSVINGITKLNDQISAIDEIVSLNKKISYYFSNNKLVFFSPVSNLKIFNIMGQQICNCDTFTQNIDLPETCSGICIIKFTDSIKESKTVKIIVKK